MNQVQSPALPEFESKPPGTRVLRCGTIGVGRMGRHHARVYTKIPGAKLVGVVDASRERAEAIAEEYGGKAYATERDLIDAGVDAVTIAVPTTAHLKTARPFLEAGVACLIEKPLAADAAEAQEIKSLAEKHNTVLMVGHIERFNPAIRAMQAATAKGDAIVPRFIEVHRVSPMTFRSVDIGVVMDMMIHDLDVVLWLMDGRMPDDVQAAGVAVVTPHEDVCNARLTWRKTATHPSCVANISASRLALKTERVTRITGENAYVKIDYAARSGTMIRRIANEAQMREVTEQLRAGKDLTSLKWNELVNIEPLEIDETDPLTFELTEFLTAARTGNRPPIDAKAGLVNVKVAEAIVRAIREMM
jgi:predicted dehydrogenase